MKKIILIAGPSGAGKTTISAYLTKKYDIPRVITHTTRPRRIGEDPHAYYFETKESFSKLHFFEHVTYGNYQYGSSKEALDRTWAKHDLVSLILDIQGIKSYLSQLDGQAYFLYVTVSNKKELKKRLLARGDKLEEVQERLNGKELNPLSPVLKTKAHILFNDDWQTTVIKLERIISSLRQT